jgi:50S ribosomal subunit-associated GTPase HflX
MFYGSAKQTGQGSRVYRPGYRGCVAFIAGKRVVLAGFFSAKQKNYEARMDEATSLVIGLGGAVVARIVQRRGVSRGGVAVMSRPLSRRTLVSTGKAREIAAACAQKNADVVVFVNELSEHQRNVLSDVCTVPVVGLALAAQVNRGGGANPATMEE